MIQTLKNIFKRKSKEEKRMEKLFKSLANDMKSNRKSSTTQQQRMDMIYKILQDVSGVGEIRAIKLMVGKRESELNNPSINGKSVRDYFSE